MSDKPSNITLARVNRLTQAVADLSESHATQGKNVTRMLTQMSEQMKSIDTKLGTLTNEMHALAGEQVLLGNRIEDAFTRALRVNIRLDELEDKQ